MTGEEILNLPMGRNDAKAETIKGYLGALLRGVWEEEESFSGKRPFGNSGWQQEVVAALAKGGAIKATLDADGYLQDYDEDEAQAAVTSAIDTLFA